ncbi:MAG: hypothetical protein AB9917_10165 [Negativicutes bacterium]
MLPLLGVVAAALLMAVANAIDNDTMFLVSSIMLLVFGVKYFKQ